MLIRLTKSERRESRQRKTRYAEKGGTKAGQTARLQISRGYAGSAKKFITVPRLTPSKKRV